MLEIILYVVLPLCIILLVVFFLVESRKKEQKKAKKVAIIQRISKQKQQFKIDVNRLVQHKIMSQRGKEAIYRIANNYFVFQKINDETVIYFEQLLKQVMAAMPTPEEAMVNVDKVQGQMSLFIQLLPSTPKAYNEGFYRNLLPALLAEFVDNQEKNTADANAQPLAKVS